MKKIKCGNCPYFTGIQCHGHGEYWGNCTVITMIKNTLAIKNKVSTYDIKPKFIKSYIEDILYEDSNCILFEIKEDKK